MATKRPHPWRSLAVLLVALLVGVGLMATLGAWTPRLGLDLRGGTSITLTARPSAGQGPVTPEKLAEAVQIIRNRVGAIAEAEVTTQGNDHIVVEVPGVGQDQIVRLVGSTAELRFRQVLAAAPVSAAAPKPKATPSRSPATPKPKPSVSPSAKPSKSAKPRSPGRAVPQAFRRDAAKPTPTPTPKTATPSPKATTPTVDNGKVQVSTTGASPQQMAELQKFKCADYTPGKDNPKQALFTCDREGTTKFVLGPAIILGSEIADASAQLPQNQLAWQVGLRLKGAGKSKFAQASTQMYQLQQPLSQFAIVLDGKVVSYPVIQGPITDGQASITGNFSQQEATDLANTLKYGALPLSFETSQVSAVSPTLGSDQLTGGLIAGAIGLALVVLYSFFYYRGLGLVVVLSLAAAGALVYASVVLLGTAQGFTLTLAGIAGLIVAIGITADSFVVYFERLRDEVREGRSLRTAVETGWVRARRTILAADSVSLLAAVVLYALSVGNVRGFAYALGLTTLIDIIIVFVFTKPLVTLLARTHFFGEGHRFSGLDPSRLGVPRERLAPRTATRASAPKGA
ncbi:protein translocase subunit SecD [Actinopolymorpha singaporensis]|uniref:Protein translocase subunit SecD n=1 Tax=Actinopolymorpha singaporensis TaxID=117157 RepID=A0A1H1VHW6_9ACTN|nr:protein translocase subunit SecD [Actinopolymorpha singaporensis]SDS83961.1 preprotein translocase subunit SecD [Actinopolymorpha singaporensis]